MDRQRITILRTRAVTYREVARRVSFVVAFILLTELKPVYQHLIELYLDVEVTALDKVLNLFPRLAGFPPLAITSRYIDHLNVVIID